MAFPQVLSVAHSQTTVDDVNHTVTMPSGVLSGDLLLAFAAQNSQAAADPDFPVGWTRVLSSNANHITAAWAYKVSDGTEGASITVTSSSAQQTAFTVYRISGHDSSTNPPESRTFYSSGTTASPNPASLTPTGGAKDYLWFVHVAADSGYVVTATDGSFGSLLTSDSGSTVDESAATSTARRELNASVLDAGTFPLEAAEGWLAVTVVVHPGSEGGAATGTVLDPFGMSGFFGA